MSDSNLLNNLKAILAQDANRSVKAAMITEAIRDSGPYRWSVFMT